jgi:putative transposase
MALRDSLKPQEKGAEMRSVLRSVRERKKSRRLGEVDVVSREEYVEFDVDSKVEMIRALVPLGLMHVAELLDDEVTELAGTRHARKEASVPGRRHGTNPGTVRLAGQRVPIRVPRVRSLAGGEIPLRSYDAVRGTGQVDDVLLKRVLYGISCRNYEAAAESVPGAIGLSSSTVSRGFIQASATTLREFQERDLSGEDFVALFLDGKTFADATMVIALGITMSGEKRPLGFVETDTENAKVLAPFLRSLVERGLDASQGLLVILDGGKGLRSAVAKVFRDKALVHRCQWHKRENVVSYLPKGEQAEWRRRLQQGYNRPTYDEAQKALARLHAELEERNQSAAASLAEGLEETLTLHRLGVYALLGRSFKTTNCLESINALVEERCAKVDHWKNSSQRQRWLATALVDIEPRLRKVMGHRHLPKLRDALKRELQIEEKKPDTSREKKGKVA